MSFQYIINQATEITYRMRPVVGTTVARSGLVTQVSRGNAIWRFEVLLPDGPRFSTYRPYLTAIEKNIVTQETVTFDAADYIFDFKGTWPSLGLGNLNITTTVANASQIYHTSADGSVDKFAVGDLIEINQHVYMITRVQGTFTMTLDLHRPLIDTPAGSYTGLNYGKDCEFRVKCISMPNYTVFGYDQIRWDGAFVFQEVIT